ncbi:hypothetical protein CHS0354_021906 [Potamilus streckersoni]|uniref:C-type lectin domain-containing protein n=1 Tax=Potamilus streckersoni TaxID=2493646 RepID=A0AAE0VXZ0_9BIVA|nr:hypothetical protein CHS0354_021906 [Potamilus streckersoni]
MSPRYFIFAQQYCQAFNSHLIRIDNQIEFHFIQGVLNELYQTAPKDGIHTVSSYWTAANDIMKEGYWVWSPMNVPMRYTIWMESEPNNYKGQENCAEINYVRQFKMNDVDCELKISFICEIYRKMDR